MLYVEIIAVYCSIQRNIQTVCVSKSLVATLSYDNKCVCVCVCVCIYIYIYIHILLPVLTINKSEFSIEHTGEVYALYDIK